MSMLRCDRCDRMFINLNEHFRHRDICEENPIFKRQKETRSFFDDQNEVTNIEKIDEQIINEVFDRFVQSNDQFVQSNQSSQDINNDNESKLYIQKKFVILSIIFFVKIQIYEQMTRKKIDSSICVEFEEFHSYTKNAFVEFKFYSFNDESNYVFVLWFYESECIKKNVNKYFKNKRLFALYQNLNFRNENEWLNQINQIAVGVSKNDWKKIDLFVSFNIEKMNVNIACVQYWDIMSAIRFLIDHSLFASNLSYVSIRQYNDHDERIYSEMHTIDWWWKTQDQLLQEITIVSILIIIDKIVFIQHHDDMKTVKASLPQGS